MLRQFYSYLLFQRFGFRFPVRKPDILIDFHQLWHEICGTVCKHMSRQLAPVRYSWRPFIADPALPFRCEVMWLKHTFPKKIKKTLGEVGWIYIQLSYLQTRLQVAKRTTQRHVLNIYKHSSFIESFIAAGGEPCVTAHTLQPTDPQVNSPRSISKENKFGSKAQNPRPKRSNSLSRQFQKNSHSKYTSCDFWIHMLRKSVG